MEHIIARHEVYPIEAEEAVLDSSRIPYPARGGRTGYIGSTDDGRVLVVILERRSEDTWRVITARDTSSNEKRTYRRRKR
jgi:uncharacterized DUF497 family protein